MGRRCRDLCQLLQQGTLSLPSPPSLCSFPLDWGLCSVTPSTQVIWVLNVYSWPASMGPQVPGLALIMCTFNPAGSPQDCKDWCQGTVCWTCV